MEKITELENIEKNLGNTEAIVEVEANDEMRGLAEIEAAELRERKTQLESELDELTRPRDPMDSKNVIVEIRAGAGGDESALFAAELMRMYMKYAEKKSGKPV